MTDEQQEDDAGKAGGPNGSGEGGAKAKDGIEALTAERDDLKDRMLRIAAEFENWKRRARKEQDDAEAKVRESVLRDMLDVIDNLERAVGAFGEGPGAGAAKPAVAPDGAAVLKGVNLVLRLFQSKLERYSVKPFVAKGEPFDPKVHEAISRVETAEVPPGAVAVELQRGYRIGERLLRPAMVSVASAPAGAGKTTPEGGDA
ncbi:MAG TPA: nucleotide exchange factor GrpE [Polyangia bacterium]